jgi:hypothetical protein
MAVLLRTLKFILHRAQWMLHGCDEMWYADKGTSRRSTV